MKIAVVSNYYPPHVGGVEQVTEQLVRGYRQAGHEVRWAAAAIGRRRQPLDANDLPIPCWNAAEQHLGFPYPVPPPTAIRRVHKLVAWADVLHVHDSLYVLSQIAARRARRTGRPFLLTQHVLDVPYGGRGKRALQTIAYRTLARTVLENAAQVVVVSDRVGDIVRRRYRLRHATITIENGVDLELFSYVDDGQRRLARSSLRLPDAEPLILFVGRLVSKKGAHLLQDVARQNPAWHFHFVGVPGDVRPEGWHLNNVSVESSLTQIELHDRYAAADILVLPSVGEGFPLVAQEALASGTPVLLSRETAGHLHSPAVLSCEADSEEILRTLVAYFQQGSRPSAAARSLAEQRWRWQLAIDQHLELLAESAPPS